MRFNLEDYETVESRIKRFYELHDEGRITTEWLNSYGGVDSQKTNVWVVKAYVYLTAGDQANDLPKATGLAFEKDGTGGANQTSALENAETSAIGRALANMALSGNKRASREEMQKVVASQRDWISDADKIMNVADLRTLYAEAKAANAPSEILDRLKDYGRALNPEGENSGDRRSGPGRSPKGQHSGS